jgi:hypothetical protein
MAIQNWLRPAILGSALGLIPLLGCFGSSNDKGDNSGGGPLPHDGTSTDNVSKPRDNSQTVTPAQNKQRGFENPFPQSEAAPSPAPKEVK